jgi:hypothetical protein
MFIAIHKGNLKIDKQKLAEVLNVSSEDIYLENQDFGLYPVIYYLDELPERADPVSYNLVSEIKALADMDDTDCIDTVAEAIDRIPDSIKIDIINKAILVGTHESNTLFEDDIIDDIDNRLSDYLLNHQEYIFPNN